MRSFSFGATVEPQYSFKVGSNLSFVSKIFNSFFPNFKSALMHFGSFWGRQVYLKTSDTPSALSLDQKDYQNCPKSLSKLPPSRNFRGRQGVELCLLPTSVFTLMSWSRKSMTGSTYQLHDCVWFNGSVITFIKRPVWRQEKTEGWIPLQLAAAEYLFTEHQPSQWNQYYSDSDSISNANTWNNSKFSRASIFCHHHQFYCKKVKLYQ